MAAEPQSMPVAEAPADELRAALCRMAETYGRGICRDPRRVAAMLRDLCPGHRRENFLLVSVLREQVVSDLVSSLDSVPDDFLVARGVRKLRDNLGLAEDSARWAVESWVPACRLLASAPDRPLPFAPDEAEADSVPGPAGENLFVPSRPVDWAWLGLCAAAILCAVVATVTAARCALFHHWSSFPEWLLETAVLSGGLAAAGFGLELVARAIKARPAPNQRALDPDRSAAAMLVEVLTLIVLPLAPVAAAGMWATEWAGSLHISGQAHDLTFHLGRIIQSLILALFVYRWHFSLVTIQGKIASSMVRRR